MASRNPAKRTASSFENEPSPRKRTRQSSASVGTRPEETSLEVLVERAQALERQRLNPLTERPYSFHYRRLLESVEKLPVEPSLDALAVPPPQQSVQPSPAQNPAQLAAARDATYQRITGIGRQNAAWYFETRTSAQNFISGAMTEVESDIQTAVQRYSTWDRRNFTSVLQLHRYSHEAKLSIIEDCHGKRLEHVDEALTLIRSASAAELDAICSHVEQANISELFEYSEAERRRRMRLEVMLEHSEEAQILRMAMSASPRPIVRLPPAPPPATSQLRSPATLQAPSRSSEQSTALIPAQDRSVVPFEEPSGLLELEGPDNDVLMAGGEST